jgi:chromosome segregation ATPase
LRLDSLPTARIPSVRLGGPVIPDLAQHPAGATSGAEASGDLDRLQQAVGTLVERFRVLCAENERLRGQLEQRDDRLRELNQRRQDAQKRIDDLVAQLDELEASLQRSP